MIYPMYKITYTKHFLTGALAGLAVPCSITVSADRVAGTRTVLLGNSPEYPASDLLTGNKYWVDNIDAERA